ncbi:MAG: GTP-binding protein, partial [Myxococcota bacterium]
GAMSRIRSFGLAAHVDAGKTSLAERILFVTGRVHRAGEIRGDRPTQLDHLAVEQRHGITVTAAATTFDWRDHAVALVDTPGHVDFTVEVERALAVLDGAVLVLDGVHGVQAQTRTVAGQMDRYALPRLVFVNKCDHPAADPARAVETLRTRLGAPAALVQWPIRRDGALIGVVDLVRRVGWSFADDGRVAAQVPVPDGLVAEVEAARERLVDAVSLVDGRLVEVVLSTGSAPPDELSAAIRRATLARRLVPALLGSAVVGIGVQPLLDAIVDWLPGPDDHPVVAVDAAGASVTLTADGPLVAWVFKTEDTEHGAWTWVRVFRGRLVSGGVVDAGTRTHRLGRLGRLHGGRVEPVSEAAAGEIVAVFGLDVASGTTLCDPDTVVRIGALQAPEPVVERSVTLIRGDRTALAKGLGRLRRDDPTLRVRQDEESGETRICGMGELHLQIAAERLVDQYACEVALGAPSVALRARLTGSATFDHLLRKQSGGPGLYARLVGEVHPAPSFAFRWAVVGGAVPAAYRSGIERAFRAEAARGAGAGAPLVGVEVVVTDGAIHAKDSNERAFALAAVDALRAAVADAGTALLEPMARVVVDAIDVAPGVLAGLVLARGGRLLDAGVDRAVARVEAVVPVARLFGFAEALRSATAGAGGYAAEPAGYEAVT